MAITPSVLNFSYKKGGNLPPSQRVNYDAVVGNVPISGFEGENYIDAIVSASHASVYMTNNLLNLNAGTYTSVLKIFFEVENHHGVTTKEYVGDVTINITITEPIILNLTPFNLTLNYQLGNPAPTPILVNVTSENNWTVSENSNWLSVSKKTGSNNANFNVNIVPTGLNIGTHTTNITVDDGVTRKILPVTLIISEPNTGTDYLYATPLLFNFGYTINGVIPPIKRVELNSSGNWKASANQSWIKLSKTSGKKGVGVLDIGIHQLSGLSVGYYSGGVTIKTGNVYKLVRIELSVFAFAEETLSEDQLYFTDDYDNIIKVSSGRTDTHLQIKASSNYNNENSKVTYNLPFFKGIASKRIGLEAKRMIGDIPFIGIRAIDIFKPYNPILLDFEINETELFTLDANVQSINLQKIQFIKGVTPIEKWLSEQSKTIFATKEGIVQFSILGDKNFPINEIELKGAVSKTYTFSNLIEPFYTVILPLTPLNLSVGDELFLKVKDVEVKIIVKPSDKEQTFIFWENKWGCWDSFECTGQFVSISNFKEDSIEYRKDFKTMQTKVLGVNEREKYKVNTGYIYSDNEVNTLRELLRATNIILYKKGQLINVRSTTKKLETSKTDSVLKSFSLTFENKIIR